jgi:hypothetical protein
MTDNAKAKKVKVEVAYTGHDEYVEEIAPETPVGTVKRKAMKQFGIEESAADNYAMQFSGANQDDKTKVGDFGDTDVKFVLVLKKPQEKGYVG